MVVRDYGTTNVEDSPGLKSSTSPTHYIVAPAWTPEPRTRLFPSNQLPLLSHHALGGWAAPAELLAP